MTIENKYAIPQARLKGDYALFGTIASKNVAFQRIGIFITELSEAVKGRRTMETPGDPIVKLLAELEEAIDKFPPLDQPMRFGNKAFVDWWQWVNSVARQRLDEILPTDRYSNAAEELTPYLIGSFGEPARIDYGTGHETCFLAFLYCCREVGLYSREDHAMLVLSVFDAYLRLVRKLHVTYVMEPAGSHGVWGLDDFHMLPFIFGAAQFLDDKDAVPPQELLERCDTIKGNMFTDEVMTIKKVKTGAPFGETSPVLYDVISQVKDWDRIYTGMCKYFHGEVVSKFPVMQHFLFGSLLPFENVH